MALGLGVAKALGEGMIVLRAIAIYLFMLVVLRVSGKRRLAELTPFDLVLLLIIAEVTEPAMLPVDKKDFGPVLVAIVSLVAADLAMSWLRWRHRTPGKTFSPARGAGVIHLEFNLPVPDFPNVSERMNALRGSGLLVVRMCSRGCASGTHLVARGHGAHAAGARRRLLYDRGERG